MTDLDTIEQTLEVIEDQIDGIAEVVEVVRNNPKMIIFSSVVGFGLGLGVGYMAARQLLIKKYAELATEEIAEAKQFYAGVNKVDLDGTPLSPQEVMDSIHGEGAAAAALREYQGEEKPEDGYPEGTPHDEIVDEQVLSALEGRIAAEKAEAKPAEEPENTREHKVKTPYREAFNSEEKKPPAGKNVFSDDTFDLEEETKYRTEDKPYIITHDEFYAAEKDYETSTLTYYQVDDVLTDERDQPIEGTDEVVGDDHLVRFGSGSKDPNVVYIRNDRMGVEYEIVRSKGSYLEEVLGIPKEDENSLKHSDNRDRRRAFRHGDG